MPAEFWGVLQKYAGFPLPYADRAHQVVIMAAPDALSQAALQGPLLTAANLQEADLPGANLVGANLGAQICSVQNYRKRTQRARI